MRDLLELASTDWVRRFGYLVVAGAIALAVTNLRGGGPTGPTVYAEFNRAGLNVRAGDEVRIRGLPVGSIERIAVDHDDLTARYTLRLDPGTRVAADTGARVVPKTMLGDKYVELDPPEGSEPTLEDGAVIPLERTRTVAELENVLDDLGTLLEAVDATAFGATFASFAEGLGGGRPLRSALEGFSAGADIAISSRGSFQGLFADLPPAAGAFERRAEELTSMTEDLASVSSLLAEEEAALATALRENAELLARANGFFGDPRFAEIVDDGLDVLSIVVEHPGQVREYFDAFPVYLEGFNSAIFFDHLYAIVAHVFAALPHYAAKDDAGDWEGRGPGPDIIFRTPPESEQPGGGEPQTSADAPLPGPTVLPSVGGGR